MLKAEVIEPSTSEWAIPIVLVTKPDGSTRFCVDYRRLNAVTVRDLYPLPCMDECIDSLGEAKIFTTLDCNSGYWQIPARPEDREKTTFTSHEGLCWFLHMPLGLRNAPATFKRFVDITLSGLTWKICLVYLDDIIVFSKTPTEHMALLDAVLHRLYRAGLTLNLKKCHFFKETVDYLGHVIRPGKLSVAEKKTATLKNTEHRKPQTELRSFLGLSNVYRRFVRGFAKIAAPLKLLLRKGETPQLGPLSYEQVNSFDTLRDALLNPPTLALPRIEGAFTLDTDASDHQLRCCLLQSQPNGSQRPVGYWSRGLTSAEKNYSTTEKECLAIVWAILHRRPYLEQKKFTIRTDHHSLRWVLNLSDAQVRLARRRLRLLEFDYEVQYHPGAQHHGADMVSRL
jgi:RNase H-like domain found in reverse transcriptase/Reverse transcriptase (RNA-dependent DNA polymerase)